VGECSIATLDRELVTSAVNGNNFSERRAIGAEFPSILYSTVTCQIEAFRPTNGLVLHHQLAHLVHPTIVVTTSIQQLLTVYLVSTTSAQHQLHNDVPHTTSNALFAVHDPAVVSELLRMI